MLGKESGGYVDGGTYKLRGRWRDIIERQMDTRTEERWREREREGERGRQGGRDVQDRLAERR